jgi:membrane-bound lytic murein transglycosylase D
MRVPLSLLAGGLALLTGCQSIGDQKVTPAETRKSVSTAPRIVAPITPESSQTPEHDDVWERIRTGMALPIPDQKLVDHYRDWYIEHPQHLAVISERAEPFMYIIVEELEKRELPIELALLPIVESAFDPYAYSNRSAMGLWQFTSPMAEYFGLEMNWWYDGRRDVPAATVAALDMLEYLYEKTGENWLYALAAYNSGEGRVLNAVKQNEKKQLDTDFWSLKLPAETKGYVPKLLALADVIKHADAYGISLNPIANEPQVEVIDVGEQIDLALAAELAGMSIEELQALNPGYNQWATSPNGQHDLVIPLNKAEQFKAGLATIDDNQRITWERYRIKSGDNLSLIAKRYRTTTEAIRGINGLKNNTIVAGKDLMVPVSSRIPVNSLLASASGILPASAIPAASERFYQVKAGDTLWQIAKSHGVSPDRLALWNKLSLNAKIRVGQQLTLWADEPQRQDADSGAIQTLHYEVRHGDSLALIANKFKVKVEDLVKWNRLQKVKYIKPGQKLRLLVNAGKMTS